MSRQPSHRTTLVVARKYERGATMVELALVLPLLLTVMFGIMESGRLALTYTTLADAARAGTRFAIVHGADRTGSGVDGPSGPGNTANVEAVVTNMAIAAGLTASKLTVDVEYPGSTNVIAAPVTVSVSYPFRPILPLVPLTVTLGSESQGMICY
jgi:Flp pilus assembly protein TadG